jgi:hypothetical protein
VPSAELAGHWSDLATGVMFTALCAWLFVLLLA